MPMKIFSIPISNKVIETDNPIIEDENTPSEIIFEDSSEETIYWQWVRNLDLIRKVYDSRVGFFYDETWHIKTDFIQQLLSQFFTSSIIRYFDISEELPFVSQYSSDDGLITIYLWETTDHWLRDYWDSLLVFRNNYGALVAKPLNDLYYCIYDLGNYIYLLVGSMYRRGRGNSTLIRPVRLGENSLDFNPAFNNTIGFQLFVSLGTDFFRDQSGFVDLQVEKNHPTIQINLTYAEREEECSSNLNLTVLSLAFNGTGFIGDYELLQSLLLKA